MSEKIVKIGSQEYWALDRLSGLLRDSYLDRLGLDSLDRLRAEVSTKLFNAKIRNSNNQNNDQQLNKKS